MFNLADPVGGIPKTSEWDMDFFQISDEKMCLEISFDVQNLNSEDCCKTKLPLKTLGHERLQF